MKTATAPSKLFRHGQMVVDPRGSGKPKAYATPQPTHGAKNVSASASVKASAFHHGIAQDDEPLADNKSYLKTPELHSATPNPLELAKFAPHLHPVRRMGTSATRGKRVDGEGQRILAEGGVLGDLSRLPKWEN